MLAEATTYEEAVQELKRADHSLFATLKYSRTKDVMLNILERFVKCIDTAVTAVLEKAVEKQELSEVPVNAKAREEEFRKRHPEFNEYMDIYRDVKRFVRSGDFEVVEEYRRNMTLIADVSGARTEINVDKIQEDYHKISEFIKALKPIIEGSL